MSSEIQTYTGRVVDPFNLKPEDIDIEDICYSISRICRFGGHCLRFYSVAEHSVYVSEFVSDENKLWGLLHDASEAYFGDLPRPIKRAIPGYQEAEMKAQQVIAEKFGLPYPIPEEVKDIDTRLLLSESYSLMASPFDFGNEIEPLAISGMLGVDSETARNMFIIRFNNLKNKKNKPQISSPFK